MKNEIRPWVYCVVEGGLLSLWWCFIVLWKALKVADEISSRWELLFGHNSKQILIFDLLSRDRQGTKIQTLTQRDSMGSLFIFQDVAEAKGALIAL